ncbi:MAG: hypothetical protein KDB71_06995 [Mycobacterium sp.]|nr:hypothetical protein [Mycobacterium sp.]
MRAADLHEVLAEILPVELSEDSALTVGHDGTFASLRPVTIADGLQMVALTQMLAWDLPLDDDLRGTVTEQAGKTTLGTVSLVARGDQADVVLRYNFPAGGLSDSALQTLVMLVLATGAEVRRIVAG